MARPGARSGVRQRQLSLRRAAATARPGKEVYSLLGELGHVSCAHFRCRAVPTQLHGIEINPYAYELAQATIWIGYIQWMRENGFGFPSEPILRPLETIRQMDAILAYDANGQPVEPDWPEADVIIGNPPFLGGNKMRAELGDEYVEDCSSSSRPRAGFSRPGVLLV